MSRAHRTPLRSPRRSPRRRTVRALGSVAVISVIVTGCLTGPRPTLSDDQGLPATGDGRVDALARSLDETSPGPFTATYRITNNFGAIERPATVVHDADGRRSITIGAVRYLIDGTSVSTCRPARTGDRPTGGIDGGGGEPNDDIPAAGGDPAVLGSEEVICSGTLDDAAVSDLQVTHQFYGRSPAARLSADARRRIGPIEAFGAEWAGREAQCLSIPVDGGSKVYCVLDTGILASYQGPDVIIELLTYSTEVDEGSFDPAP